MTPVVLADLVGSTSMFEGLGDETSSRFVTRFSANLSQLFAGRRGRAVKLLGDGCWFIARQMCMTEQCNKPAFKSHKVCEERRAVEQRKLEQRKP